MTKFNVIKKINKAKKKSSRSYNNGEGPKNVPDAKSFQLLLNQPLVAQWLQYIQNNKDKVGCSGDGDDLSTTTLTILSSLNDTWQIQQLDFSSLE